MNGKSTNITHIYQAEVLRLQNVHEVKTFPIVNLDFSKRNYTKNVKNNKDMSTVQAVDSGHKIQPFAT